MRWIRGDYQIVQWIKSKIITRRNTKKINPLGLLSKFKIADNLRRNLLSIFVLMDIFLLKNPIFILIVLIAYVFSTIIDIINYIVFKKGKDFRFIYAHKSFNPLINSIRASLIRGIIEISFLPHKAYISICSIAKSIYRMKISKKKLLEWVTSEQAEKQAKTSLSSYYIFMFANTIFCILILSLSLFYNKVFYSILGILWIIGPIISWYISKDRKTKMPIDNISVSDKEYLLNVGKKIWQFFDDNINEENNYLPPDNYQEDRKSKIARKNINYQHRTWITFNNICI